MALGGGSQSMSPDQWQQPLGTDEHTKTLLAATCPQATCLRNSGGWAQQAGLVVKVMQTET